MQVGQSLPLELVVAVIPAPGADAPPRWARRHASRDFELSVARPDALVLGREDGVVGRLGLRGVRLVGDGKSAALGVLCKDGHYHRQTL